MVFNATFNNISAISWRSVLLVEETGVPGENHRRAANHWQTLSHIVVSRTPRLSGIRTHKISGDRHRLHLYIQLPYNHDDPLKIGTRTIGGLTLLMIGTGVHGLLLPIGTW